MTHEEKHRLAEVYNNLLSCFREVSSLAISNNETYNHIITKMKIDYEQNMEAIRTIFICNGVHYTLNERYIRL